MVTALAAATFGQLVNYSKIEEKDEEEAAEEDNPPDREKRSSYLLDKAQTEADQPVAETEETSADPNEHEGAKEND